MGPEHRTKIANSQILNRLIAHVEGDLELSQTQVSAGLGLLKKVMADMTHNENETTLNAGDTIADLFKYLASNGRHVTDDN